MPDECPFCGANFQGDPIPEEHRESYGGKTHFSRVISIYDQNRDCHNHWKCPDCEEEWK